MLAEAMLLRCSKSWSTDCWEWKYNKEMSKCEVASVDEVGGSVRDLFKIAFSLCVFDSIILELVVCTRWILSGLVNFVSRGKYARDGTHC